MTTHEFLLAASTPHTALSHLALYGLAAILDDAGHDVGLSWTDTSDPRPRIHSTLEPERLGETVHAHATHRAEPESWLQATFTSRGRTMALLSPRISKLDHDDWPPLQQQRHHVLDTLHHQHARLDLQLLAALGEPCYWSFTPHGDLIQDDAATRWDMQPRNRGSEIVTNRLRPLAAALATWPPEKVLDGLTGTAIHDPVGEQKTDSRTATGLAPPGPTDNALAWCALWGISQLPTTHRPSSRSRSTGHHGPPGAGTMYLPAWTRPWPLARLRAILTRPALHTAADPKATETDLATARRWLHTHGIPAVITFPVHRYGTDKAPERRTQHGTMHPTS